MKVFVSLVLLAFSFGLCFSCAAWADPWAVVADYNNQTIHTVDLADPTNPVVYGPFLGGSLGNSGELLDVVVTRDGKTALVSNYHEKMLFFIDLTDPTNPSLLGSVNIGFKAEDIALTPDNRYALVVDGGSGNQLAILDIASRSLLTTYTLSTANAGAQCVATDGNLVVICDRYKNRIIYGPFNSNTGLTSENTLSAGDGPTNAVFSPDGETLLVANHDDTVHVYRLSGTNISSSGTVTGLPGRQQSIAFSPNGKRAYVISTNPSPFDSLSWLQISGPGSASLGGSGIANLLSDTYGRFFGVDVLAVTPSGQYALAGNPNSNGTTTTRIALINLSTFGVNSIPVTGDFSDFPVGIAIFQQSRQQPTMAVPILTTWGMIFFLVGVVSVAAWKLKLLRSDFWDGS